MIMIGFLKILQRIQIFLKNGLMIKNQIRLTEQNISSVILLKSIPMYDK